MKNNYDIETRSRWGNTDAYREHEQKTKSYTKEKWAEANDGLMSIFAEFAVCKESGASADSAEAQTLVAKLQAHITENYYSCTDEILSGLGKMFVADLPPSSTYLTVCSFISSLCFTFPIVISFLYYANAYDTTLCPLMQIHTSPSKVFERFAKRLDLVKIQKTG